MSNYPQSPIAFLVFNRPDCTARTLEAIRTARPPRLLVVADGPRPTRPDDQSKCLAVRKLIDNGIDWPCDLERNYAEVNMGCAERVADGLNWAFSRADHLTVVEDDCLPDPSFFRFCNELLVRYADDQRIGQICGSPFIYDAMERPSSYVFSRYGPIWGWASWSRAWKYYSLKLDSWPQVQSSGNFPSVIPIHAERRVRRKSYSQLHTGPRSTWDIQWGYAKMANSMLSIIPTRSLIENIGFGPEATHTTGTSGNVLTRGRMGGELRHPELILADAPFDRDFSLRCCPGRWDRLRFRLAMSLDRFFSGDPA